MDRRAAGQDTDEESIDIAMQMEFESHSGPEIIVGLGFWNDFGDLLDEDDLT